MSQIVFSVYTSRRRRRRTGTEGPQPRACGLWLCPVLLWVDVASSARSSELGAGSTALRLACSWSWLVRRGWSGSRRLVCLSRALPRSSVEGVARGSDNRYTVYRVYRFRNPIRFRLPFRAFRFPCASREPRPRTGSGARRMSHQCDCAYTEPRSQSDGARSSWRTLRAANEPRQRYASVRKATSHM